MVTWPWTKKHFYDATAPGIKFFHNRHGWTTRWRRENDFVRLAHGIKVNGEWQNVTAAKNRDFPHE